MLRFPTIGRSFIAPPYPRAPQREIRTKENGINGYKRVRVIVIVIVVLVVVGVIALQFVIPLFSGGSYGEALSPLGLSIAAGVGLVALLATWFAFRAPALERREFRDAPLGVGTLVSARATGTSINDQPEVELRVIGQNVWMGSGVSSSAGPS